MTCVDGHPRAPMAVPVNGLCTARTGEVRSSILLRSTWAPRTPTHAGLSRPKRCAARRCRASNVPSGYARHPPPCPTWFSLGTASAAPSSGVLCAPERLHPNFASLPIITAASGPLAGQGHGPRARGVTVPISPFGSEIGFSSGHRIEGSARSVESSELPAAIGVGPASTEDPVGSWTIFLQHYFAPPLTPL